MRMKTAAIHLPLLFFLLFCITSGMVSGYDDKARVHNGNITDIIKPGFSGGGGGGRGGGFTGGSIGGRSGGVTGSRGYTGDSRGGSGPGVMIAHGGHDGGHGRNGGAAKDPVTAVFIAIAADMMVLVTMILA